MRFTISRDTLKTAMTTIIKGMDMNSTLPILSGVLLTAFDSSLTIEATNMQVSIRQKVLANIEEPGQAVVPCKLLSDIVGHLPDTSIQFSLDGSVLSIECGKSLYHLNTLPPQDFPSFPDYEVDNSVEVPTSSLNDMVSRVAVAASPDSTKGILNGVLINITNDLIRFVTTDSVRLAVAETRVPTNAENFEVIAPSKYLKNVISLAAEEKTITIGTNETQIVFIFGDVIYITRRIEGVYPNYRKLIPDSYTTGVRARITDLYEALQRIKAMTISNTEICFDVNNEQGVLVITSNIPDQGNAREELSVETEGQDIKIAFNSRYIYDCIQKTDESEYIQFECESPTRPGIFKSFGKIDFLYLVMPVRMNY